MILEADETFAVLATAVVEQFECKGPCGFAEFAVLEHFCPLGSPQMVFNHIGVVLRVNHSAFVNKDFCLVPFAERLLVLRFCRNHVVE